MDNDSDHPVITWHIDNTRISNHAALIPSRDEPRHVIQFGHAIRLRRPWGHRSVTLKSCVGRLLAVRCGEQFIRLQYLPNLLHIESCIIYVIVVAPGNNARSRVSSLEYASITLAHIYHTFSASIRHVLFACVNASHIFCVAHSH